MSIAFLNMHLNEGGWGSKSVIISTNNFILQEVELLRGIFKAKFNLDCTIKGSITNPAGSKRPKDKYSLYIKVSSLPRLR